MYVPLGHFYSPVVDVAELKGREDRVFAVPEPSSMGVDLREAEQLALLAAMEPFYLEVDFPDEPAEGHRYFFRNPSYSYSDAIFLFMMLRHLQPRRIIEVGSGYSTCAILDIIDAHFDRRPEVTLIEPFPELLLSLIREGDKSSVTLHESPLQDVDNSLFSTLEEGDVLFVDSTHVCKTGSDVNHLLFRILPTLNPGVHVHIHDVFYPFEYPRDWVYEGRGWNEIYVLRAFLQYNSSFRIVMMNTMLQTLHPKLFDERFPLCLKNTGGSIWIRRE